MQASHSPPVDKAAGRGEGPEVGHAEQTRAGERGVVAHENALGLAPGPVRLSVTRLVTSLIWTVVPLVVTLAETLMTSPARTDVA
jgi:hypothetical protein